MSMYHPIFYNDWRLITVGTICLIIILAALIICLFNQKIPWIKKWFSAKKMINIMFILAIIMGIAIAWSNDFKIFDQNNQEDSWIKHLIYLVASIINICVTIMFLGFVIILPFRYFLNIFMFTRFRRPQIKFIKVSLLYLFFGSIALLISSMQYFMKDNLLGFASEFSSHPLELTWDNYPTLFFISNWLLIKGFSIKGTLFGFVFLLTILAVILIEYIIVKLMYRYNYRLLKKMVWIASNVSNKTSYLVLISPVFTFTAMLTSLMVQTAATFLRISLIFILMSCLLITIYAITCIYSVCTKSITFKGFNKSMLKAFKIIAKNPVKQDILNDIKQNVTFQGFNDFDKEQEAYNIFLTSIFPLIIVAYLGFSSGPLFDQNFTFDNHLYFWIMIFVLGYVLMFAYAMRFSDLAPMKIVLANTVPYIRSGFNVGILNFFNNYINKLSLCATFSTYLAIACKHDYHYKKVIK